LRLGADAPLVPIPRDLTEMALGSGSSPSLSRTAGRRML